jgi:hypothetical protein
VGPGFLSEFDFRPGGLPGTVFVPTRREYVGEGGFEVSLAELADGRWALPVYTSLDRLLDRCGQGTPWAEVRSSKLQEMRRGTGFDVVAVDVALPAGLNGADPVGPADPMWEPAHPAWWFNVFLQRFVGGEEAGANRGRVREAVQAARHAGDEDYYSVYFDGGVYAELEAIGLSDESEPFEECSLQLVGFSMQAVRFVFDVARAGDMVLFTDLLDLDDAKVVLTSPEQEAELPASLCRNFRRVLCATPDELAPVLAEARRQRRPSQWVLDGTDGPDGEPVS